MLTEKEVERARVLLASIRAGRARMTPGVYVLSKDDALGGDEGDVWVDNPACRAAHPARVAPSARNPDGCRCTHICGSMTDPRDTRGFVVEHNALPELCDLLEKALLGHDRIGVDPRPAETPIRSMLHRVLRNLPPCQGHGLIEFPEGIPCPNVATGQRVWGRMDWTRNLCSTCAKAFESEVPTSASNVGLERALTELLRTFCGTTVVVREGI